MPSKLKFEIILNADGFKTGLQKIEAYQSQANARWKATRLRNILEANALQESMRKAEEADIARMESRQASQMGLRAAQIMEAQALLDVTKKTAEAEAMLAKSKIATAAGTRVAQVLEAQAILDTSKKAIQAEEALAKTKAATSAGARMALVLEANALQEEIKAMNASGVFSASGRASAFGELIVIFREIGRGNWSRIPGSISILTQRLGLLKYLLTPFAGILAGVAIAGYALVRWSVNMATAAQNMNNIVGRSINLFADQAREIGKLATKAQEYADILRKLGTIEQSQNNDVDRRLKNMREEYEFKKKMAEANGGSKADADKAEKDELTKERDFLKTARTQAALNQIKNVVGLNLAHVALENTATNSSGESIEQLNKKLEAAGEILDAVKSDKRSDARDLWGRSSVAISGKTKGGTEFRETLDSATAAYDGLKAQVTALAQQQKSANDIFNEAKERAEKGKTAWESLNGQVEEADDKLNTFTKYGMGIPDRSNGAGRIYSDSGTRTGNFLGSSPGQIGGGMGELIRLNRNMARSLDSIDRKMSEHNNGSHTMFQGK